MAFINIFWKYRGTLLTPLYSPHCSLCCPHHCGVCLLWLGRAQARVTTHPLLSSTGAPLMGTSQPLSSTATGAPPAILPLFLMRIFKIRGGKCPKQRQKARTEVWTQALDAGYLDISIYYPPAVLVLAARHGSTPRTSAGRGEESWQKSGHYYYVPSWAGDSEHSDHWGGAGRYLRQSKFVRNCRREDWRVDNYSLT